MYRTRYNLFMRFSRFSKKLFFAFNLSLILSAPLFLASCASSHNSEELQPAGLFLSDSREPSSTKEKLRDFINLPEYFLDLYGDERLYLREGAQLRLTRSTQEFDASKGPRFSVSSLVLESPRGSKPTTLQLARAFFDFAAKDDADFELAVQLFVNLNLPSDPNGNLELRAKEYFVSRLSGSEVHDELAALWFKLKFEATEMKSVRALKKGDPILLIARQFNYVAEDSNAILRALDAGHAVFALRYFQNGPELDTIFNAGAKNIMGSEVALPFKIDSKTYNMLRVSNFWDWIETQIVLRHMRTSIHAIALNKDQAKLLQIIKNGGDKLNWGFAVLTGNNCADGASRLINALLPIDKQINPLILNKVAYPPLYFKQAARAFKDFKSFEFSTVPNPAGKTAPTPGTSYLEQDFGDRSKLKTFNEYLSWETELNY